MFYTLRSPKVCAVSAATVFIRPCRRNVSFSRCYPCLKMYITPWDVSRSKALSAPISHVCAMTNQNDARCYVQNQYVTEHVNWCMSHTVGIYAHCTCIWHMHTLRSKRFAHSVMIDCVLFTYEIASRCSRLIYAWKNIVTVASPKTALHHLTWRKHLEHISYTVTSRRL